MITVAKVPLHIRQFTVTALNSQLRQADSRKRSGLQQPGKPITDSSYSYKQVV